MWKRQAINTDIYDKNYAELTKTELEGFATSEEIPEVDYLSITNNGTAYVTEEEV